MFGTKANLTNIGKNSVGKLVVSNVIQKAGIEVNEEGSSAHAVTGLFKLINNNYIV